MKNVFEKKIEEILSRVSEKPRIGFGLLEPSEKILESLERSKPYADIVLVGPKAIESVEGFELVISENPEEQFVEMIAQKDVDGVIRGTIDDFITMELYNKRIEQVDEVGAGLMQTPDGHEFFLVPASNPSGWEKEERLLMAERVAAYMRTWDVEPYVAVLTGVRHGTYERRKAQTEGVHGYLNSTYEDAEWIVGKLREKNIKAKNWTIEQKNAVYDGANIVLYANGMIGNQVFRALLLSGSRILAIPRILYSYPFEDNSRTETDYEPHVRFLVAMMNKD